LHITEGQRYRVRKTPEVRWTAHPDPRVLPTQPPMRLCEGQVYCQDEVDADLERLGRLFWMLEGGSFQAVIDAKHPLTGEVSLHYEFRPRGSRMQFQF